MRLLRIAARHPEHRGSQLVPLALNSDVLTVYGRYRDIEAFLRQVAPGLSPDERLAAEDELRSFPERLPSESQAAASAVRDKLLPCLIPSELSSMEPRSKVSPPVIEEEEHNYEVHSALLLDDSDARTGSEINAPLAAVERWIDGILHGQAATELDLLAVRADLRALHAALTDETDSNARTAAWVRIPAIAITGIGAWRSA